MPATARPLDTRDAFAAAFGTRPVTSAEAHAHGFSRGQLRAAVARGLLATPRHGVLSLPAPVEQTRDRPSPGSGGDADHASALRAALASVTDRALATDDSAAALHGMAVPTPTRTRLVQLGVPGARDRVRAGIRVRGSWIPPHRRILVDGIPATDVPRTAIDLARGRPLPDALISLDSAARLLVAAATGTRGNALRASAREPGARDSARRELDAALRECRGWPGTAAVARALPYVDPAAESALESRSRGWFVQAGIAHLEIGSPIRCGGTTYWADFCDPIRRVIGEADGWTKYGSTGDDARRAVERERRRQRDLESDGWTFVRWLSTDTRLTVVHRMLQALDLPLLPNGSLPSH